MGDKGLTGGLIDYARRQPAVVIVVLVLVGLYLSKSGSASSSRAVLVPNLDFPAPSLLVRDRSTYVVGVDPRAPETIRVLSSRDRRSWTVTSGGLRALPGWADPGGGLGPAAIGVFDDSYVLYYTAQVRGLDVRCVSAATSRHLDEPFVDTSLAPFVCQPAEGGSTDPSPFVDASGRPYLAWSSPGRAVGPVPTLWAQPLRRDGLVLTGDPAVLLRPSLGWQQKRVASPSMISKVGHNTLVYSAAPELNDRQVVATAQCTTPLGPCRAADRPMLTGGAIGSGPGGAHAFADTRDHWWLGLHSWDAPPGGSYLPAGRLAVVPLKIHDGEVFAHVTSTMPGQVRTPQRHDHGGDRYDFNHEHRDRDE